MITNGAKLALQVRAVKEYLVGGSQSVPFSAWYTDLAGNILEIEWSDITWLFAHGFIQQKESTIDTAVYEITTVGERVLKDV